MKISKIAILLTTGLLIIPLYVAQVNAGATKGYELRHLIEQENTLKRDQERLLSEITRLRSLSSIKERQMFLDLVPTEAIVYLNSDGNSVALR